MSCLYELESSLSPCGHTVWRILSRMMSLYHVEARLLAIDS